MSVRATILLAITLSCVIITGLVCRHYWLRYGSQLPFVVFVAWAGRTLGSQRGLRSLSGHERDWVDEQLENPGLIRAGRALAGLGTLHLALSLLVIFAPITWF